MRSTASFGKRCSRSALCIEWEIAVQQLQLALGERRGGARAGAGRKRLPAERRHTPHRARPRHCAAHPVHVTLRAFTRSLRAQQVARTVLGALRASHKSGFRIVHYSLQANHLHLIVEASDTHTLSSGVRGLMVRMAKRVNRLLFRRGRFWADRWHGHTLKSPREVRNALVYVLKNHEKHAPQRAAHSAGGAPPLDDLSSAPGFDGFTTHSGTSTTSVGPPCTVAAHTWLLSVGWRRRGLINRAEAPRSTTYRHS